MDGFPLCLATSGPTKRRKHYLCLLFSQYCLKSKTELPFGKSIPGLPRLEPHRKVNATTLYNFSQTFKTLRKTANLFSNLDFLPKSRFPKTLDLSMDFPWISPPPPPPTNFRGGRGSGRQKMWGGVGGPAGPPVAFFRTAAFFPKHSFSL